MTCVNARPCSRAQGCGRKRPTQGDGHDPPAPSAAPRQTRRRGPSGCHIGDAWHHRTLRAESPAVSTIRIEAGARFFDAECRRCHAVDSKDKSYGPPLEGVIGRPAGSVEGYPYSPALKAAGFTWTEGALRAWMEDNQGLIPGTKMRHVGITDPVEQAFILAWLGSVSAPK
ncbi:c-type cytochrome [Gemmobacter lanyuensis]